MLRLVCAAICASSSAALGVMLISEGIGLARFSPLWAWPLALGIIGGGLGIFALPAERTRVKAAWEKVVPDRPRRGFE